MAASPQGLEENEQGKARDIVATKLKFTSRRGNKSGVAKPPQAFLAKAEQGKARDVVALKLKFTSGREVNREITTVDIIDNLDMTSYHWENMCRSYWERGNAKN